MNEGRKDEVYLAALAGLLHDVGKAKEEDPHIARVVELADRLAAGGAASRKMEAGPLQSIFCGLETKDANGNPQKKPPLRYWPLKPLALEWESLFPHSLHPQENVGEAYQALWQEFEGKLDALQQTQSPGSNVNVYLENVLLLMQRYTWCIPSAYGHALPDVSLYDHNRMTAALAAVMADESAFPEDRLKRLIETSENSEEEVALLVGGDISGVQDFIYTISSKGAAKMLRGRSFYLQLLTEAVLRFVLRKLGLPYTSVIYSGGGHFYLLAPLSAKDTLPKLQAEVGKILLQQHGTQLYLVLGYAPVPAKGFQAGALSEYWQEMQNALTIAKNRRYAELQAELYKAVFTVPEYGGNPNDTCSVCGDDRREAGDWDEWEAQSKICPLCRSFAETIGTHLPKTRFLALKFGEPQSGDGIVKKALDILRLFGMDVQFLESAEDKITVEEGEQLVIWALDDPQDNRWPETSQPAAHWLRYTANRVPMVKDRDEAEKINQRLGNLEDKEKARVNQPMTFSHLNVLSESGFEQLGVLRMDVDNLGTIFKEGLGASFSLSRMATLSFQISLFFEGWLKRIVEEAPWDNLVYTVYAGGDDLFLIAPWDKVPALAQKIVDDFADYTGHHPGLHISGGMAFIDGKYPIYQAADDAADAETLAKKGNKNAFAFLNQRWSWDAFRELAERKDELKALVKSEAEGEREGPKSALQTLRALAQMEGEAVKEKDRPAWGRWMWLGAYQLARMEEHYKNAPDLKEKIARLREKLGNFQYLGTWGAAARWAQLETRRRRKNE